MIQSRNDFIPERSVVTTWLAGVNLTLAMASGVFGIIAMINPSAIFGSAVAAHPATLFFASMYGARAVAIAAGLIAACILLRRAPIVAAAALIGGALVQAADAFIAARFATPGLVGPAIAAAVHAISAGIILMRRRRGGQ